MSAHIILITGERRSGKTTLAEGLRQNALTNNRTVQVFEIGLDLTELAQLQKRVERCPIQEIIYVLKPECTERQIKKVARILKINKRFDTSLQSDL